ncbi:MAG: YlxR family protein [Chloroflexi bacterium]|nr:YlxR family protein [Chloroflexota bacterium]
MEKAKRSDIASRPTATPQRRCVACRRVLPKAELVRLVRTADGGIQLDRHGKEPGRGAYLCPARPCWLEAMSKGRLERALRIEAPAGTRASLLAAMETEKEAGTTLL